MPLVLRISILVLFASVLQARKPFLQLLIEDGFASSEINVVYYITGKDIDSGLFRGSYPRVLIDPLKDTSNRTIQRNQYLKIASQSLVVIDARKEPMRENRCLLYLTKQLQRIDNPGGNRFVLLVDETFREQIRIDLKYLQDTLHNLGIGYTLVLPYDQVNSPDNPLLIARISFGHQEIRRSMNSVNFQHLFRLEIAALDGIRVSGVLYNFFPFSYTRGRNWAGTDFYVWNWIIAQFRLRLQFTHVKREKSSYIGGAYSLAMLNRTVDFIATRDMIVEDGMPKLFLNSRDYFSLIVPRPLQLNLIDALLQPFSAEVWLMIGVLMGIRVLAGHFYAMINLLDRSGTVRKRVGSLLGDHYPWPEWIQLASDVLTFLLIEAYLAQVTSLLLTLRYIEGPKNLNEFLASNIKIVQPYDTNSLIQIEPEQKRQLISRFVKRTPEELAQPIQHDAYMELRSRVLFLSYGTEPIDPVTGRRNFYILDEPLADVRFQYSFSKETAFMMLAQRSMLWFEENGLRMHVDRLFERWAKIQNVRKEYGINGTVLGLTDLNSLWICVAVGWCASGLMFLVERAVYARMLRRTSVPKPNGIKKSFKTRFLKR